MPTLDVNAAADDCASRQSELTGRLQQKVTTFEAYLDRYIKSFYESTKQQPLGEVIAYALTGRGKRVRPLLAMLAAEACGQPFAQALPAALALEFIHTYSLVHDDLPCMDNDDLRRGRPTTHKAFDEARALLAGDGLLTDAFAFLSNRFSPLVMAPEINLSAEIRLALIYELSTAAGSQGMVHGQALDLYWTGRGGASRHDLDAIHRHKTGYLIGAACAMGALSAAATPRLVSTFREFGELVGLAFQITDDLLDDSRESGKTLGKDRSSGKLTYLACMSADEAHSAAMFCTQRAEELLAAARGDAAKELLLFSRLLLARRH